MAPIQRWEYLTIQIGAFGMSSDHAAAKFVNGMEIKDWKKVPLHSFIIRLGADGWEMSGTFTPGGSLPSYLFFKRPMP